MLAGALLAYLALRSLVPLEKAVDPNQMYYVGFDYVFDDTFLALAATAIFVVISQLKINVTNAWGARIPDVVDHAIALETPELYNFAPGFAIASSRHETQYSSLFRS